MRLAINRAIKGAFAMVGLDVQYRQDPAAVVAARLNSDPAAKAAREHRAMQLMNLGLKKIHYASANRFFGESWINVDLGTRRAANYLEMDLTDQHPFPDGWFRFGFAEDFLEHLDQEQSMRFLIEAYRTLQPGGVLRLSFPGLEGTLRGCYTPATFANAQLARAAAYEQHGHKHFYCREELRLVATHVGFGTVRFVEYGESVHHELRGLDYRHEQIGLNIYVEVVK